MEIQDQLNLIMSEIKDINNKITTIYNYINTTEDNDEQEEGVESYDDIE